jgi:hypothetical protein
MIQDRLDDKFIISIDPKPERVLLTNNLAGENIYIGAFDKNAPHINIFDVLVVPNANDDDDNKTSDPLTSQYQANLISMATLLSLNPDIPNDKIILSVFNDVQQYVYEKIHNFSSATKFQTISKNNMPIMKEFYNVALQMFTKNTNETEKQALNNLCLLMKEHAVGISSHLFNLYSNID